MKYKVGDRVAIRRDMRPGDRIPYCHYFLTKSMHNAAKANDYIGTITQVFTYGCFLDISTDDFYWEDWMFEGLAVDFEFCSKEVLAFLEEL